MKGFRYKKQGWFGDSHRHYLASKGIRTKLDFNKNYMVSKMAEPEHNMTEEERKNLIAWIDFSDAIKEILSLEDDVSSDEYKAAVKKRDDALKIVKAGEKDYNVSEASS